MEVTRRGFIKTAAVGTAALGFDLSRAHAEMREYKVARTTETRSTCPYCSVSCGLIVHTLGDGAKNADKAIVYIEGDPDHPINRGTLCPKGAATRQLVDNPYRWTTVRYRAPYSDRWEERPLDWAMERIARLVKETRDQTFVERGDDGGPLNHTLAIAHLGGATLDSEENYLIKKLFTALGAIQIENQARI